jgi:TonB-linked SusC/RagA family outer membrane protein
MKYLRQPKLLLLTVFSFLTVALFAQEVTITGTVTNKENGQPLEGVSVRVKNTTTGTTTNNLGKFTIKAPSSESILTFSYVGFGIFERKAGATGSITIDLERKDDRMEEVVVIGYGSKKRVNVQGSVATIKAADIEDLPVANIQSALINRLPGVGVSFSSGKPGSTTTLNIRNSSTFPGAPTGVTNQPLIVIDGIIANPTQWAQAPNADWMENIDASQIEDITFLKDASAAIYGAAGAKGVVLITTKKGKAGKPRISYSGYFGVSTEAVKTNSLSAYEHAKFLNDGYELTGAPLTQRFSQADLDSLKMMPDKSWYDYFWKSGKVQRHTINVSGGTDKVTLFAGGSYYNETGNFGITQNNKYSFRTGMNATIADGLSAQVNFASDFNRERSNNWKNASSETDDATIRALYLTPKWIPVEINGLPVGFGGNAAPNNNTGNQWSMLGTHRSGTYRDAKSQGLSVNASVEWKPKLVKGFAARVQFGNNTRTNNSLGYYPTYLVYLFQTRGQNGLLLSDQLAATPTRRVTSQTDQIEEGITTSKNYQFITTLSYGRKFGDHDFDVMAGFDQGEAESKNYLLSKTGQIVGGVDEFWAFNNDPSTLGSIQDALRNPQFFKSAKRSYITRANYSFMGRYFFEFIGRADASVNFLPSKRWGFFPTIGVGWKISDEGFFRDVMFVNSLKLRANYGIVGEDRVGTVFGNRDLHKQPV